MKIKSIILITFMTTFSLYCKNTQVPTDIFYAIDHNDLRGVRSWVKSNPDVAIRDKQGRSILTAAVFTGNHKLVQVVLKTSVDVNLLDHENKTALDRAAQYGHEKIVFNLIKHGAKVTNAEHESLVITMLKRKSSSLFKQGLLLIFVVPLVIIGVILFGIWAEWYVRPYIGYKVGLTLLDIILPIGALSPIVGLGMTFASTPCHIYSQRSYILETAI